MLAGHGIICWADSAKACYDHTVSLIADAARYLNAKLGEAPAFGGMVVAAQSRSRRNRGETIAQIARADDGRAQQGCALVGR